MSFAYKEGRRLLVARPPDPELAVTIAAECEKTQDHRRLRVLPEEVCERTGGEYTFVGYLAAGGCGHVLDARGLVIDRVRAGDSFFTDAEGSFLDGAEEALPS